MEKKVLFWNKFWVWTQLAFKTKDAASRVQSHSQIWKGNGLEKASFE